MTPQEEFTLMLEKSGVTNWHNKGFNGKGINILNCESFNTSHGKGTGTIMKRVAPNANFFCGSTGTRIVGDILDYAIITTDDGKNYDLYEFVRDNKINIMSVSKSGISDSCQGWIDYMKKLQDDLGVVIFNSAANEGEGDGETISTYFPTSVSIIVGAITINGVRASYSSVGEELDFMAYSGLIGGTSAATPFLAGMMACAMSKYGVLTPKQSYGFLKYISKDLGTVGDDIYYGEGMPILPSKTNIRMQIGSNIMQVDGIEKILDQAPIIDASSNRTLVPVRAISEAFGATVNWDGDTKIITIEV